MRVALSHLSSPRLNVNYLQDLHLYHGAIIELRKGDILGHEYMGGESAAAERYRRSRVLPVVEQVGPDVKNLKRASIPSSSVADLQILTESTVQLAIESLAVSTLAAVSAGTPSRSRRLPPP